jgi:hypothetical protein
MQIIEYYYEFHYKGYLIKRDAFRFIVHVYGYDHRFKTLRAVKSFIDRVTKEQP